MATGTDKTTVDPDSLTGRELDAAIAEHVLGWKPIAVGPDVNGENACEILAPEDGLSRGIDLPRKGKIHRAYLVRQFSDDLYAAVWLAQHQGMTSIAIDGDVKQIPTRIARMVLRAAIAAARGRETTDTEEGR
jgi:hypothetical protein